MRAVSLVVLLAIASAGCATQVSTETAAPSVSQPVEAGSETLTSDANEEMIIIDVRSQSEWDAGHVDQAVHIPHTEIGERIAEVTSDKDAKIVVYCAVGGRAEKAKTTLNQLGFTNVENGGGFEDVQQRLASAK